MQLFHRKIDNPLVISLDLKALGRDPDAAEINFTTCDPVAFWVTLVLKEPEEVGRLIVRFYGTSLANLDISGANGKNGGSSQPWLFFEDMSVDIKKTLGPGIHKWSFISQFPEYTDPGQVKGDESFSQEKSSPRLFQNCAHPLPPSCRIKTDHWGIDTQSRIWYAIDAEYTRLEGRHSEPGKLMTPVSLDLNYKPLSTHYIPSTPRLVMEQSFRCKSKALVDGQEWDGIQMARHEKILSQIDPFGTPTHTFKLELYVADHYTIGKPMPMLLRVVHNHDGRTEIPWEVVQRMPMLLRTAKIEMRTWANMRGTMKQPMTGEGVDSEGAARDALQHSFVLHDTPRIDMPRYLVPGVPLDLTSLKDGENGPDGPSGERAFNYVPGEPFVWSEREDSPPSASTYNLCIQQTVNIRVKVAFAGLEFDLEYQEDVKKDLQWWKRKDVVELRGNMWSREHNLRERFGLTKKGCIEWDVPEVEKYVFERN